MVMEEERGGVLIYTAEGGKTLDIWLQSRLEAPQPSGPRQASASRKLANYKIHCLYHDFKTRLSISEAL